MDKIIEKYRDLTNVDIEDQKKLWDERGKGYYGEFLVFNELFSESNISGVSKILMNIQIPASNNKSTEIDLLMIHETGIYVFEVKHYKGTIYGKNGDRKWTQYFRTESNKTFINPIEQNQYHITAIKKMYPDVPVYSFIVFTNPECDLRVECTDENISVCTLRQLVSKLQFVISKQKHIFDLDKISNVFDDLRIYSPIVEKTVILTDEEVPFYDYLNKIIGEQKKSLEKNEERLSKKLEENNQVVKKIKIRALLGCFAMVLVYIITIFTINKSSSLKVEKAMSELKELKHNFEHVSEFDSGNIVLSDDLIEVTDIALENSKDIVDTVNFSCVLNWHGEAYGIRLAKDTKFIVLLEDGTAKEYDLFGGNFMYAPLKRLGKGAYEIMELPICEFYGINAEDISYVKLVNLCIWKDGVNFGQDLFSGYELELYNKQ